MAHAAFHVEQKDDPVDWANAYIDRDYIDLAFSVEEKKQTIEEIGGEDKLLLLCRTRGLALATIIERPDGALPIVTVSGISEPLSLDDSSLIIPLPLDKELEEEPQRGDTIFYCPTSSLGEVKRTFVQKGVLMIDCAVRNRTQRQIISRDQVILMKHCVQQAEHNVAESQIVEIDFIETDLDLKTPVSKQEEQRPKERGKGKGHRDTTESTTIEISDPNRLNVDAFEEIRLKKDPLFGDATSDPFMLFMSREDVLRFREAEIPFFAEDSEREARFAKNFRQISKMMDEFSPNYRRRARKILRKLFQEILLLGVKGQSLETYVHEHFVDHVGNFLKKDREMCAECRSGAFRIGVDVAVMRIINDPYDLFLPFMYSGRITYFRNVGVPFFIEDSERQRRFVQSFQQISNVATKLEPNRKKRPHIILRRLFEQVLLLGVAGHSLEAFSSEQFIDHVCDFLKKDYTVSTKGTLTDRRWDITVAQIINETDSAPIFINVQELSSHTILNQFVGVHYARDPRLADLSFLQNNVILSDQMRQRFEGIKRHIVKIPQRLRRFFVGVEHRLAYEILLEGVAGKDLNYYTTQVFEKWACKVFSDEAKQLATSNPRLDQAKTIVHKILKRVDEKVA